MTEDFAVALEKLQEVWKSVSASSAGTPVVGGSAAKTELEQNIQALENFTKTKCRKVPIPTFDTSICELWGFGYFSISRGVMCAYQKKYPWLDTDWLINLLMFKTKWLVVSDRVMNEANKFVKGGPRLISNYDLKRFIDSRFIELEMSYRRYDWDAEKDLFTGTYDHEDPWIKQYLAGELSVVGRGFCRVCEGFVATPLLPTDLYNSDLCKLHYYGVFPKGSFGQFVCDVEEPIKTPSSHVLEKVANG